MVIADVIKWRILRWNWSSWIIQVGSLSSCPWKRHGRFDKRKRGDVNLGAEISGMWSQTQESKQFWQPPEAGIGGKEPLREPPEDVAL